MRQWQPELSCTRPYDRLNLLLLFDALARSSNGSPYSPYHCCSGCIGASGTPHALFCWLGIAGWKGKGGRPGGKALDEAIPGGRAVTVRKMPLTVIWLSCSSSTM